jgi:hypothetical protein
VRQRLLAAPCAAPCGCHASPQGHRTPRHRRAIQRYSGPPIQSPSEGGLNPLLVSTSAARSPETSAPPCVPPDRSTHLLRRPTSRQVA